MSGRGELVDDRALLTMLWLVEGQGLTFAAAGQRLGTSRSAVAGALRRVRMDSEIAELKPVKPGEKRASRPENLDGGMPERWWQDGLKARKGTA
jgi:ParB-like chromosome segregation protein Spo0J